MFEKIVWDNTYGYKNFITEDLQKNLLIWVNSNLDRFVVNPFGPARKNKTITKEDEIFSTVQNIKKKIMELENKKIEKIDFSFRDYIGINFQNAFIQIHRDETKKGYTHTRWNLVLSHPIEGGDSIYDGQINKLQERIVWKCEASKFFHGSTRVIGEKPRITLSMGFML